ncbi:MAG: HTH-type transcriptional regulator CysL [Xylophilus sp.]|nr:MAG: HTH-type transcriptional regulator CysL [Xylophilus sp.]
MRAVAAGLVEAGIVTDAVDAGALALEPLAHDPLVLAVPPQHALARTRAAVALADVLGEPFVGLAHGSALQAHVEQQIARIGRRPPALRIRMADFEGVCAMVSQGVGLGIVPQAAARAQRRRHPLRTVALSDAWARRRLCLCTRGRETLSAPMRALSDHLAGTA